MKAILKTLLILVAFVFTSRSEAMMYRARPYDPNLGRWLTRDPMEYGDGVNLYEYVSSNPVNRVDPFGLYGNPVSGPEGPVGPLPNTKTFAEVVAEAHSLDIQYSHIKCCCLLVDDRASITVQLRGTAAGTTVTDTTSIPKKDGCVENYLRYYWWDCFAAKRSAGLIRSLTGSWRPYGYYLGGESSTRTEVGSDNWVKDFFWESNKWNWEVIVIYSACEGGRLRVHWQRSNQWEWTWNATTMSWGGAIDPFPGQ